MENLDKHDSGGHRRHPERRRQISLPADERQRREDVARELFAANPHMGLEEAQARTAQLLGTPMSKSQLSAIRGAYRTVKRIPKVSEHPRFQYPMMLDSKTPVLVQVEPVKEKLRAMVLNGKSPKLNGPLAKAGRQLVAIDSPSYDAEFAKEMEANAPPWFFVGKRALLLALARDGQERPRRSSDDKYMKALAQQLSAFVTKSSTSYDPKFDIEIRTLRPDWFKKNGGDDGE